MTDLSGLQIAALTKFALDGFTGTSMAHIAGEAGIRKSSIYAHFSGKEELFLSLLEPVMAREQGYLANGLNSGQPLKDLFRYLDSFLDRADESPPYLKFLMRSMNLPPEAIRDKVAEASTRHYLSLWRIVDEKLAALSVPPQKIPNLSTAYIGILDSIQTSVLFAPAYAPARLKSLWNLFKPAVAAAAAK